MCKIITAFLPANTVNRTHVASPRVNESRRTLLSIFMCKHNKRNVLMSFVWIAMKSKFFYSFHTQRTSAQALCFQVFFYLRLQSQHLQTDFKETQRDAREIMEIIWVFLRFSDITSRVIFWYIYIFEIYLVPKRYTSVTVSTFVTGLAVERFWS